LGDLLLLPKDFNASYGDMEYPAKLEHYGGHNLLARSLQPLCYTNNPSFLGLISRTGLPFKPYPETFVTASIAERQELYRQIAELVWDPTDFGLRVPERQSSVSTGSRSYGVSIRDLMEVGLVEVGAQLAGIHSGVEYSATITADGRIRLDHGDEYDAPSTAAMAALDRKSWNGWSWWRMKAPAGSVILSRVREDYIERHGLG
jgi:hypothetical protein